MKRICALLAAVVMLVLLICACADHSDDIAAEPTPAPTGPIYDSLSLVTRSSFPYISLSLLENEFICDGVFDSLLYMDLERPDDIKGCLAESWTHSDDYLTWTFQIKEGVSFTDGTACDANAIAEAFDLLFGSIPGSGYRGASGVELESWQAAGEYELVMQLSRPCAWFETQLCLESFRVISPTAFKLWGESDIRAYVGTGPYKIREYEVFDAELEAAWLILEANPDYHCAERIPLFEELSLVTFSAYTYPHEEVCAFLEDKTLDFVNISSIDSLMNTPNVAQIYTSAGNTVEFFDNKYSNNLWFNVYKYKPFGDRNVREAISRLIDAERLNEEMYGGTGIVNRSLWEAGALSCVPFDGYAHDAELGLSLLAEAGKSPQDISLEVLIRDVPLFECIRTQLEQYGIVVENAYYEYSSKTFHAHDYGLSDTAFWGASYGNSLYYGAGAHYPWMALLESEGPLSYSKNDIDWLKSYEPKAYDIMSELYERMTTTPHWDEMIDCAREMTRLAQECYLAVPLPVPAVAFAVRPDAMEKFEAFRQTNMFKWRFSDLE